MCREVQEFYTKTRPVSLVCIVVGVALVLLCGSGRSADDLNVEDTRVALQEWVDTQRIISKERRDLSLAKEMLNERIDLVQREIESLQEKIAEAEKSIAEAGEEREELVKKSKKLEQASSALTEVVITLEKQIGKLLVRLPEPIGDRIKPLSQRLPENPEESELSLSERFQNVVGMLNEINKFNREVTVRSEVRALPDGQSAEVTAMYLGIGQGYYSGANGTVAGLGTADEHEWIWRPMNEAAATIDQAIGILRNDLVAAFVRLPVEIQLRGESAP
jgi:hypothetical protein